MLESYATGNASATAARHNLHITQLNNWKKQLLKEGEKAFLPARSRKNEDERKIEEYEKVIGRLTVQNEILKKTKELLT